MKYKMKTIADLLESIARTNNGYIFAPNGAELAIAMKHTDIVDIRNGQIHNRGMKCEHARKAESIKMHINDGPDYEALILSRQEKELFY